jgi:hypothetical protein
LTPKVAAYENIYEYDAQHNRVLILHRILGDAESYSLTRFKFDDGKKIEEQYYGSDVTARRPHTKVVFYYTGNQADSTITYQIFQNESDYKFGGASYFTYDAQGRLIEEQKRFWNGSRAVISLNNYENELLQQSCNPVTEQEGVSNCTRFEYNVDKKLIRKYATLTGTVDLLLEENSYTNGLLTETKVFNQKYYLPAYDADPTPYTLQIKYEY